jgi:hypothetical protein
VEIENKNRGESPILLLFGILGGGSSNTLKAILTAFIRGSKEAGVEPVPEILRIDLENPNSWKNVPNFFWDVWAVDSNNRRAFLSSILNGDIETEFQ